MNHSKTLYIFIFIAISLSHEFPNVKNSHESSDESSAPQILANETSKYHNYSDQNLERIKKKRIQQHQEALEMNKQLKAKRSTLKNFNSILHVYVQNATERKAAFLNELQVHLTTQLRLEIWEKDVYKDFVEDDVARDPYTWRELDREQKWLLMLKNSNGSDPNKAKYYDALKILKKEMCKQGKNNDAELARFISDQYDRLTKRIVHLLQNKHDRNQILTLLKRSGVYDRTCVFDEDVFSPIITDLKPSPIITNSHDLK